MNIDDSFDKKLIINQVDNALIEKAKENEVIYHNIIEIVETAKKESDTKEIEDITNVNNENEIDFEEIVANAAKNRKMSLDSRKSNHSKVEDEEEDEDVIEDKEDEEIKDDTIAFEKNEKIRLLSGVGATDEDENAMEIDEENKEDYRMVNSCYVDERALREIYLTSFEMAVKDAKVSSIMTSDFLLVIYRAI